MFKINRKIALGIENEDDEILVFKFLDYKIIYDICPLINNFPGVIICDGKDAENIIKSAILDIDYVENINIFKDIEEIKINDKNTFLIINKGIGDYTNTITLDFNNGKKLIFYNIDNFGLAGCDFFLYKEEKIILRSVL